MSDEVKTVFIIAAGTIAPLSPSLFSTATLEINLI